MSNLKKIFLVVVFFSFLYVALGYTAKQVLACHPDEWSGCGGRSPGYICDPQYVRQCGSNNQWGECQWDPSFCGGGNTLVPPAPANTCSGITYSTVPTTPVPGQGLQLDISRAGATSSCGINNVGLIYDGVSSWSSNPGFGLILNGATGYRTNFSSIPAGTHTFQFTFANDACKCNTFSLNILSNTTPVITQPAATVTPISSSTTPANCPLKQKGDANCDGKVDDADYQIWKCEFLGGGTCTNPSSHLTANFDLNTKVDLVDFEIWRSNRN